MDVAREAGVHIGTVSRALNPATRSRVNAETAARIIEVARQLGYEVNIAGRALRTQRTQTIGALIPDLTNPSSHASSGASRTAWRRPDTPR